MYKRYVNKRDQVETWLMPDLLVYRVYSKIRAKLSIIK